MGILKTFGVVLKLVNQLPSGMRQAQDQLRKDHQRALDMLRARHAQEARANQQARTDALRMLRARQTDEMRSLRDNTALDATTRKRMLEVMRDQHREELDSLKDRNKENEELDQERMDAELEVLREKHERERKARGERDRNHRDGMDLLRKASLAAKVYAAVSVAAFTSADLAITRHTSSFRGMTAGLRRELTTQQRLLKTHTLVSQNQLDEMLAGFQRSGLKLDVATRLQKEGAMFAGAHGVSGAQTADTFEKLSRSQFFAGTNFEDPEETARAFQRASDLITAGLKSNDTYTARLSARLRDGTADVYEMQSGLLVLEQTLGDVGGATKTLNDEQMSDAGSRMHAFKQSVIGVSQVIGGNLFKVLGPLIDFVTTLNRGILDGNKPWRGWAATIGVVALAFYSMGLAAFAALPSVIALTAKFVVLNRAMLMHVKVGAIVVFTWLRSAVMALASGAAALGRLTLQLGLNTLALLRNLAVMGAWRLAGLVSLATTIASAAIPAIIGATGATWAFTVALLANPITWVVLAVVALGAALFALWKHWDTVGAAVKKFGMVVAIALLPILGPIIGIIKAIRKFGPQMLEAGKALWGAFVDGIKSVAMKPVEAVKGALAKVRKLLPFSDAKEGPLSTLTLSGMSLVSTLSAGIQKAAPGLHARMLTVFEKLRGIVKGAAKSGLPFPLALAKGAAEAVVRRKDEPSGPPPSPPPAGGAAAVLAGAKLEFHFHGDILARTPEEAKTTSEKLATSAAEALLKRFALSLEAA